jgi:hypothetical protein
VVRRENDEMYREARRERRKGYEYFERLKFVRVVRRLSMSIWRVKEKGNEARNTFEENERERQGETLSGLLGITRRSNQSQFGKCPNESIEEHRIEHTSNLKLSSNLGLWERSERETLFRWEHRRIHHHML